MYTGFGWKPEGQNCMEHQDDIKMYCLEKWDLRGVCGPGSCGSG